MHSQDASIVQENDYSPLMIRIASLSMLDIGIVKSWFAQLLEAEKQYVQQHEALLVKLWNSMPHYQQIQFSLAMQGKKVILQNCLRNVPLYSKGVYFRYWIATPYPEKCSDRGQKFLNNLKNDRFVYIGKSDSSIEGRITGEDRVVSNVQQGTPCRSQLFQEVLAWYVIQKISVLLVATCWNKEAD